MVSESWWWTYHVGSIGMMAYIVFRTSGTLKYNLIFTIYGRLFCSNSSLPPLAKNEIVSLLFPWFTTVGLMVLLCSRQKHYERPSYGFKLHGTYLLNSTNLIVSCHFAWCWNYFLIWIYRWTVGNWFVGLFTSEKANTVKLLNIWLLYEAILNYHIVKLKILSSYVRH